MDAARAVLARENAALKAGAAELAVARAKASEDMALIAQQKLRIAKLERQVYGQRSERSARLIDQLALQLRRAGSQRHRRRAGRGESRRQDDDGRRIYAQAPRAQYVPRASAARARGDRPADGMRVLRRQSPAQARRGCDAHAGNDAAPVEGDRDGAGKVHLPGLREDQRRRRRRSMSLPRGWAGPSLLAMIVFEKFGQHQPLNRQAERYALEGVPIALSTMADAVGSVCAALDPLLRLVEAHVMAAERLHGDDTTVPVLAKGKTDTGRCWVYVRDDKPFGGAGPPAAMFYYSRDRRGEHPQTHLAGYAGILQADAYDGYNKLYLADRKPGPIREAACWVHARRPFFAMADLEENARRKAAGKKEIPLSPIAIEIVRRIDALFEIERSINGKSAEERLAVRRNLSRPLVDDLQVYMREQAARLSRGHDFVQGDQLHSQALACLHPVPRGWARLPFEQRRRARAARHRSWEKIMAVLRFRRGDFILLISSCPYKCGRFCW